LRHKDAHAFSRIHNIDPKEFDSKLKNWKALLLKHREKREKPMRDDKRITSWNALMIKAYADAYFAFQKEEYLRSAIATANFLIKEQMQADGQLYRIYKDGRSSINAYLEDYAFSI